MVPQHLPLGPESMECMGSGIAKLCGYEICAFLMLAQSLEARIRVQWFSAPTNNRYIYIGRAM